MLSTGVARNNEAKVMRQLLLRADQNRSLLVRQSQREIAVAIDVHQPTVSKTLARLEDKELLVRIRGKGLKDSDSFLLTAPHMCKVISLEEPENAGSSSDNTLRAYVHPLFGSGGLGAGVADTMAQLSEYSLPLGRHRLLRLRQGTITSGVPLSDPYVGLRQIPAPARPSRGRSIADLAASRRRHPDTIRRHLETLARHGLAFQSNGLWWRVRFAASTVMAELDIIDTVERKEQEYERQRRQRYQQLASMERNGVPVLHQMVVSGCTTYVSPLGEVVWTDPQPLPDGKAAGESA